jgi:hypothetical protein
MLTRICIVLPLAVALIATPAVAQLGPAEDPETGTDPSTSGPIAPDPSPVQPDTDADTARLLLSAHHGIPEADVFADALVAPTRTLRGIATNPDVFPLYRQRALSALAYWPDAWLADELSRLATDPASGDLMQHHAVLLLARVFPDRATDVVDAWLYDDDVQRRLTAIESIVTFGEATRREALSTRLMVETSPVVAGRIREALQLR